MLQTATLQNHMINNRSTSHTKDIKGYIKRWKDEGGRERKINYKMKRWRSDYLKGRMNSLQRKEIKIEMVGNIEGIIGNSIGNIRIILYKYNMYSFILK